MGKRRAESQEQAAVPPGQGPATPAAPAEAGMSADDLQRLQELAELHKQGVLTDEEFAAQKARILS
jgi:hypothetical protein